MVNNKKTLKIINETLNTDYERLSQVPDDKLKRVWMLLKISQLMREYDIKVFSCRES